MGKARAKQKVDPAAAAVADGWAQVAAHPLFAPMCRWRARYRRTTSSLLPADGWAAVDADGNIVAHPTRVATPSEWAWVFTHLLLHLGFGHANPDLTGGRRLDLPHAAACCVGVHRFQSTLRIGSAPMTLPESFPGGDEAKLAQTWREAGIPKNLLGLGTAAGAPDVTPAPSSTWRKPADWESLFAAGLTAAVTAAVDVVGGIRDSLTGPADKVTPWGQARSWFISSYPLLGSVLASLTLVADADLARGWDIQVAAVDATAGELYVNPHAQHTVEEWRFILAHEALHAALAHHARAGGRDPELFNIACDFIVNGWLVEMGVGLMPEGLLYDPQFAGKGAEEVYDIIAVEARRYRKLATLRGHGKGDLIGEHDHRHPGAGSVDLDELLRRSLATGLALHEQHSRGLLPAGLVAEIRALAHPPLTWDVALARWFDERFPAVERERSYGRPSRRQSATPHIPRPGWRTPEELVTRRTFGVVLDTSMSMNAQLLGKALGAIASYAASREVPAARVVFCDAAAYDAGYLSPDDIADRVRVKGRGGTMLQPGLDLLERAEDFPTEAPILVITDGEIDVLRLRRDHAYLMPAGATLPFRPKGPIFRVQ